MLDVEHRTDDLLAARPIRGRAAIEALTLDWLRESPEFDFRILGVLADSASAAYRWRHETPGPEGIVAFEGITWLTCADGEIERALVYFDSHQVLTELGRLRPA